MSFSFFRSIRLRSVALILVGLFVLVCASYVSWRLFFQETRPRYGITFSTTYTSYLGLNVEQTFKTLVDDLGVRAVRLPVYWYDVEPNKGDFRFETLDWLVKYAEDHGVKLTLAIGEKVPRWPECYVPDWARTIHSDDKQTEVKALITAIVNRYKNSPALERWQVENDPYFLFGVCEQTRESDLKDRINLVRSLDAHPIQMTVSGEIEPWADMLGKADVLGISMYRKTWNQVLGYFVYPLTHSFYTWRLMLADVFFKQVIVSELQAEPWFPESLHSKPLSYWYDAFDAKAFEDNIKFIEATHAKEVYLWGAEWWVYMKVHGDERLWNVARKIFIK